MESPPFKPDRVLGVDAPAWDRAGVLLVGGSFDPVHEAHTVLADQARRLAMDGRGEIVFVPAARSPHKREAPLASDRQRVDMLGLAALGLERWSVWTHELDRATGGEPSYWIDTLREARSRFEGELRFLIGADQAVAFHLWREPREILDLARPVVLPRRGIGSAAELADSMAPGEAWSAREIDAWKSWLVPTTEISVSASAIREALADPARRGAPIDHLDANVHAYILRHGLYRGGSADD